MSEERIKVLGIDPAIEDLGWSIGYYTPSDQTYDVVLRGMFNSKRTAKKELKKDPVNEDIGLRTLSMSALWDWCREMVIEHDVKMIVCEDNFMGRFPHAFRMLTMIVNTLALMLCREFKMPLYLVTPTAAKLGVSGHGGSGKFKIIQAIDEHNLITMSCGMENITTHEADSVGIGYTGVKSKC